MFKTDLLAPYLLKEWMNCDQNCNDIALIIIDFTLFSRSDADSFLK